MSSTSNGRLASADPAGRLLVAEPGVNGVPLDNMVGVFPGMSSGAGGPFCRLSGLCAGEVETDEGEVAAAAGAGLPIAGGYGEAGTPLRCMGSGFPSGLETLIAGVACWDPCEESDSVGTWEVVAVGAVSVVSSGGVSGVTESVEGSLSLSLSFPIFLDFLEGC